MKRILVFSLIAVAAAIGLILFYAMDNSIEKLPANPEKVGKLEAPFTVSLYPESGGGEFRTLKAVIRTDIDIENGELVAVPFDAIELISPLEPILVSAKAGEEVSFSIRIRILPDSVGACTAELKVTFPDGSTLVANDSIRFAGGDAVRGDLKPLLPRINPVRIQDVPAPTEK